MNTQNNPEVVKSSIDLLRKGYGQAAVTHLEAAFANCATPDVAMRLGSIYEWGTAGVPIDYARAAEFYERALQLGDISAYANLGRMHLLGRGRSRDYLAAYRCFLALENKGIATSSMLVTLGRMRQFGWGIPVDLAEAERYYREAARFGNVWAIRFLGLLLLKKRRLFEGAFHVMRAYVSAFVIALRDHHDPRLQLI